MTSVEKPRSTQPTSNQLTDPLTKAKVNPADLRKVLKTGYAKKAGMRGESVQKRLQILEH